MSATATPAWTHARVKSFGDVVALLPQRPFVLVMDIDETVLYAQYPDAYDAAADDAAMGRAVCLSDTHDTLLHGIVPAATHGLFLTGRRGQTEGSRRLTQRHLRAAGFSLTDGADAVVYAGHAHKGPALMQALTARGLLRPHLALVYLEDNQDSVRSVQRALREACPESTVVVCEYAGGFNHRESPLPYSIRL